MKVAKKSLCFIAPTLYNFRIVVFWPRLSKFNEWVEDIKPEVNYIDNRWAFISYIQLWIAVKFGGLFVHKMIRALIYILWGVF